jgi:uncharacterized protein
LLAIAEREGRVRGELVVVPHCNPTGLKQFVLGRHLGRFDLADGRNFNRGFPDIAEAIIDRLSDIGRQKIDAETAIEIGASILSEAQYQNPGDQHRLALLRLSWGSDIVIDVHSDMESVVHMYSSESSWPKVKRLAETLAARAVMLSDVSSDRPFDEVHSFSWRKVEGFLSSIGRQPTPRVSSCTVELRGLADVEPSLARTDAAAFYDYLVEIGALSPTSSGALSTPGSVEPTSLNAVDMITSPRTGVLVHCRDLGEQVVSGDVVARVFDPMNADPSHAWIQVRARTSGLIFARWHQRVIRAGMAVCKVAGKEVVRADTDVHLLD